MQLKRMIEIGIDATKASRGGKEVESALQGVKTQAATAKNEITKFQEGLDKTSAAGDFLRSTFARVALSVAAFFAVKNLFEIMTEGEEVMISLANSTKLTAEELGELDRRLGSLTTQLPKTKRELAEIAQVGYSLGGRTVQEMEKFTEAFSRISLTTDVGGKAGAELLGRILKLSGEPVTNVGKLGGAINALADEFGVSGAGIAESALDVIRSTANFEVASTDALALAAALKSVGADAGAGLAVSRLFKALDEASTEGGRALDLLAKLSGKTSEEFKRNLSVSAVDALEDLIAGLGRFQQAGGDVRQVLEALDIGDARLSRSLLPLIKNYENLSKAIRVSRDQAGNAENLLQGSERAATSLRSELERLSNVGDEIIKRGKGLASVAGSVVGFVREVAEQLFGLSSQGETSSRAVFAVTNAVRLLSIALGVMVVISAPQYLFMLGRAALGSSVFIGVASVAVKSFLVVLTGLVAFDFGRYIYNRFEFVQTGAAKLIAFVQTGWETVKTLFRVGAAYIEDIWFKLFDQLKKPLMSWLSDTAAGLQSLEDFFDLDLGSEALDSFAKKLNAIGSDRENIDSIIARIQNESKAKTDQIKSTLDITLAEIERDFSGKGGDTGESYISQFGKGVLDTIDSAMGPVRDELNQSLSPESVLPNLSGSNVSQDFVSSVQEISSTLTETGEKAEEARAKLSSMFSELSTNRGIIIAAAGDQEKIAENTRLLAARLEITSIAAKAYGNDLLKAAFVVETYVNQVKELEKLQSSSNAASAMIKSNEAIAQELSLMSESVTVRENAAAVLQYAANAQTVYGENTDEANEATKRFVQRLEGLERLRGLRDMFDSVSNSAASLFTTATFELDKLKDEAERVVKDIARLVFEELVTRQIAGFFSGIFGSYFGLQGYGGKGYATGGVFSQGNEVAFASGGVIDSAVRFPLSGGRTGLMGEAGPEAILPLTRGRSGKLGVEMSGGWQSQPVTNNYNLKVYTQDADSFRRSSGQVFRKIKNVSRR